MPFSIRLFELLEEGKLPRFQEARKKGLLFPLNPYSPLLFLSHRWRGEFDCDSDNAVFDAFVVLVIRILNRLLKAKFLKDSRDLMNSIFPLIDNLQDRAGEVLSFCARVGDRERRVVGKYLDLHCLDDFALRHIVGYLKTISVWVDYTCLPQRAPVPGGERSVEDEELFRSELVHLADIIACSCVVCIWSGDELSRAWCVYEYMVALLVLGNSGVALYMHGGFDLRERQMSSNIRVLQYKPTGAFTCIEHQGGAGYSQEYVVKEKELAALRESVTRFVDGLRSSSDIRSYLSHHHVRCSNGHDIEIVIQLLIEAVKRYGSRCGMTDPGGLRHDTVLREKCVLALQCLHAPTQSACVFDPILNEHVPLQDRHDLDEPLYQRIRQQSILEPYTDYIPTLWLNPLSLSTNADHVPLLIRAYRCGNFACPHLEATNDGLVWVEGNHLQDDVPSFKFGGGCEYDWTLPALNSFSSEEYALRKRGGVIIPSASLSSTSPSDLDASVTLAFPIPHGCSLLNTNIDKTQTECLNVGAGYSVDAVLFGDGGPDAFLQSDEETDEQLLINLEFQDFVRIHSFKFSPVRAQESEAEESHLDAPRKVLLFVNTPAHDFGSVEDAPITQELTLGPNDFDPSAVTMAKFVKFQNVKRLSIFIESNEGDEEVTRLARLYIIGSVVPGMNIKNLAINDSS